MAIIINRIPLNLGFMTTEKAFSIVLRKIRSEHSLSQEELGFESGVHRTYISLLERGKRSPSLKTIFRLARAMNISASELIFQTEERLKESSRADRQKKEVKN